VKKLGSAENRAARDMKDGLLKRDFLVDYRPGSGIRLAPHFYTIDEQLELVIRQIQSISTARWVTKTGDN
jgi:kynureninase